jgi:hypothetical protein
MREQITLTLEVEQLSIRELSLDEMEIVGGGFSWGGLVHKAESIAKTAVHNVTHRNWSQVTSDGETGGFWGGLVGGGIGLIGGPEGAGAGAAVGGVIGGLVGVDIALAHQDGLIGFG